MASLAATNYTKPLVVVPCLSWTTASSVFTEGVMSEAIDWDLLQYQYLTNPCYHKFLSRICKIVDDPFKCQLTRSPGIAFVICFDSHLVSILLFSRILHKS